MKFIVLASVSLSANDEYYSSIEDIFLGCIEAESKDDALEKVNPNLSSHLNTDYSWICEYDYDITVVSIDKAPLATKCM